MNLAVVHSVGLRILGGMERALLDFLSESQRQGHHALICCRPGSDFGAAGRLRGLEVIELPLRGEWDLASWSALRTQLRTRALDAVLVTLHRDARISALARWRKASPVIVMIKGIPLRRGSLARRATYRWCLDGVIAPTAWLADEMNSHSWVTRLPVEAIPDGLDESRFPASSDLGKARASARELLGVRPGTVLFMSAGHFVSNKNFSSIPARLAGLPSGCPWEWWIAGDGPEESVIRGSVRRAAIGEQVRFLGRREDVPSLLLAVDAVLVPSLHEQLPLIALEACRAGVPHVLVSRTGDQQEMTRLGIELLGVGDERAWNAAMARACESPGGAGALIRKWDRDLASTTARRLAFVEARVRERAGKQ